MSKDLDLQLDDLVTVTLKLSDFLMLLTCAPPLLRKGIQANISKTSETSSGPSTVCRHAEEE